MVMLGEEEREDQEILLLSLDRWSQRRMIRKLDEFDQLAQRLERAALSPGMRQLFRETRAVCMTIRTWLAKAIQPAGFDEATNERSESPIR